MPNPARPDLPGDPRPTPGSHRDRSKELPTTRPAHTKRTEHASSVALSNRRRDDWIAHRHAAPEPCCAGS